MSTALQILFNGLVTGALYALAASGFSLIYSTSRFMHFAHGSAILAAGYLAYTFYEILHWSFALSVMTTIPLTGFFGLGLYLLVYAPLKKKNASNVILLIAGVALLIFFQNLTALFFGSRVKTFDLLAVSQGIDIGGATITPLQIGVIATSLILFILLYFFIQKSFWGRKLRAVANHPDLAEIVGIDVPRVVGLAFFAGSALAGVAGILIGLERNLFPSMGAPLMVSAFVGAVIGGMDDVPGAVVGCLLLGLIESVAVFLLPSGYREAVSFTILFLFLIFRPQGLFGKTR